MTEPANALLLGYTASEPEIIFGNEKISLSELREAWKIVWKTYFQQEPEASKRWNKSIIKNGQGLSPSANLLVKGSDYRIPWTNCEYDTACAVERAGVMLKLSL
jgi:hypothetical protein